jgi:hypothetical protein
MKSPWPIARKKHTLNRLSLWPLKPEDALEAFMRVDPAKVQAEMQEFLGQRGKKPALPNG